MVGLTTSLITAASKLLNKGLATKLVRAIEEEDSLLLKTFLPYITSNKLLLTESVNILKPVELSIGEISEVLVKCKEWEIDDREFRRKLSKHLNLLNSFMNVY